MSRSYIRPVSFNPLVHPTKLINLYQLTDKLLQSFSFGLVNALSGVVPKLQVDKCSRAKALHTLRLSSAIA